MAYPTTSPLDAPMQRNDAKASNVREYLLKLLDTLLAEEEGFSGKRPFGNSGWLGEIELALVKSGHVKGTVDEDGFLETSDEKRFQKMLKQCVSDLRSRAAA